MIGRSSWSARYRAASLVTGAVAAGASVQSFEDLFLEVADGAFRLAVTLTRDRGEAEDLLQDAALSAFRSFATFTPGTRFKAWFYRILINRHRYRYRSERGRPATVELEDAPDLYLYRRTAEIGLHADGDPAAHLMRKMTSEQVRRGIAGLPAEFRTAVSLFFLEEMSYEEVAAVLGCPVGTVRSRLHRGRRMLQKRLWQIARDAGVVSQLRLREAPT